MQKLIVKYLGLPESAVTGLENPVIPELDEIMPNLEYPAYTKHIGEVANYVVVNHGVQAVQGINFADYYLDALADRQKAKKIIPSRVRTVFIYNIGTEPVERKELAASLLNYLIKVYSDKGCGVILVSDQNSGNIARTYNVTIKSRINL